MKMMLLKLSVFITVVFFCHNYFVSGYEYRKKHKQTDIVLIGGMGDLSRKYLLSGFFTLISKYTNDTHTFAFYPSGRTSVENTKTQLFDTIDKSIKCHAENYDCLKSRTQFVELTRYVMLKTNYDFRIFCKELKKKWTNISESGGSVDVIFYLSIPSSGYVSTAAFINNNCRMTNGRWSLKVVLEKPFGNDKESAQSMSIELSQYFEEEEIYRVDHYLGKTICGEILNFRKKNEYLENLLNRYGVDHVEIFMKETLDVKGRIDFYDQTGVIKDVFQNHLTELMTLVAMEIPQDNSWSAVKTRKLHLLGQVEAVKQSAILLGQYSDYVSQARDEGSDPSISALTPTFAAAMLQVHSHRWEGVPFILVSGKKLSERSSYVRVIFKRNEISVDEYDEKLQQLVFHIGHGKLSSPSIIVSRSLGEPTWPNGFSVTSVGNHSKVIYSQKEDDLFIAQPDTDSDAYTVLIEKLFLNDRDKFIGSDHLMALWDIWSDVAKRSTVHLPRLYEPGDVNGYLTFRIVQNKLDFKNKKYSSLLPTETLIDKQTPSTYLGNKLVSSETRKLAFLLAKHIHDSITSTLKVSKEFHVAFSGGKSPNILFEALAEHFPNTPWRQVHIWQVDERCVPPTDHQSNLKQLETKLLRFIRIPHFNVHPMPVDIASKLCSQGDNEALRYEEAMQGQLRRGQLDYVVLGMGADGHTASLFPHSPSLRQTGRLVILTEATEDHPMRRMTLTLHAINNARHVSVLVLGKEKQLILNDLENKKASLSEYPILGVQPAAGGTMTWFIDGEALDPADI